MNPTQRTPAFHPAAMLLLLLATAAGQAEASGRSDSTVVFKPETIRRMLGSEFAPACGTTGAVTIEGFSPGDVLTDLEWKTAAIDTVTSRATLSGIVVLEQERLPVAGIRVIIGRLSSGPHGCRLTIRTGVFTDEGGFFLLSWDLHPDDVLLVSMLGHLEGIWPIGRIHPQSPQHEYR